MIGRDELVPYEGREHAKAKHELLESYISRYAMILGVKDVPSLAFVDGFAGPWQSGTTDFSDTSFGLSVTALTGCAEALRAKHHRQPTIRALWIEENPDAFAELEKIAARSTNSRITITAERGLFQNKIDRIVEFVGQEAFAFIFIDPKGYKGLIGPEVLAPLLRLPRVELLINYMWDHIKYAFGHRDKTGHVHNLRQLYGEHTDRLLALTDPVERDEESLAAYESELRRLSGTDGKRRLRVLSYPIKDTHGAQHTKYYLVHATHDARGLVTFAEECDKTDRKQGMIFQIAQQIRRDNKTGTQDLFANQVQVDSAAPEPVTLPWLGALPAVGNQMLVDTDRWADLLEAGRCLPSALQAGARELILQGVIQNVDARRQRPKRPINYEKNELVQRVK